MCEWAADQLGPAELEWLRSLPSQVRTPELPNLLGIHATLRSDDDTVLPTADEATFVAAFGGSDAQVITCGHIHRPYVRTTGSTTVVGVGSVGFPADRDPRACYAVLTYEDGRWTVEHRRVEYDVDSTVRFLRSS